VADERVSPPEDEVRALVASHMDGRVELGAFFRSAGGRSRRGLLGMLLWGWREAGRGRARGLGTFTYLAVNGPDVGLFDVRWEPLRVHRVIGHWPLERLVARRLERDRLALLLDEQLVELVAAAPGIHTDALIDRLVGEEAGGDPGAEP
jgi:hypothetical protein